MTFSTLGAVVFLALQSPAPSPTPADATAAPAATTAPAATAATTAPAATAATAGATLALPKKTAPRLFVIDLVDKGAGAEVVAAVNQAVQDQATKSHSGQTVTATQIRILLSAQAEQQLIGCDSELCMTDLGRTIEADRILGGSVARVGDEVLLTLTAVDPVDGRRLGQAQRKVPVNRDLFYYAARQLTSLLLTGKAADPRVPVIFKATDKNGGAVEVSVIVDGKQMATTSTYQGEFEPGQHEVILRRDGFIDWKTVVDVAEATPLQIDAQLVASRIALWPAALVTGVLGAAAGVTSWLMADYALDRYAGEGLFPWTTTVAGKSVELTATNAYKNVVPTNSAELCQRELEISFLAGRATDGGNFGDVNACGVPAGPGMVHYLGGLSGVLLLTSGVLVTADLLSAAPGE
jgi:hypothetical protein